MTDEDADALIEMGRVLCRQTAKIAGNLVDEMKTREQALVSQGFYPCEKALVKAYELGLMRGRQEK